MRAKKGGIVKGVGTELFSHKGWNVQQVLTRIPNCTQNSFLALCIPISNQIYNKKIPNDMLHNQSACLPVSHIVNFSFFPPTVRNLILKSTPGNKCETEVSRHAV